MWKNIIKNRTLKLRNELIKIKSNRGRLEYIKNFYSGKTAIIVGTGDKFTEKVDFIKENFTSDCILICIKQSLKSFEMTADFHLLNHDHMEEYKYSNVKPIVLFMNYSKPNKNGIRNTKSISDINFFLNNMPNCNHSIVNILSNLNKDNLFELNDKNMGPGENMRPHGTHIIFEMAFPLSVTIGCKNIITLGWVGGPSHGVLVKNELDWNKERYKFLFNNQIKEYEHSKKLSLYFYENYNIHLFSFGHTNYQLNKIEENDFKNLINYRNLIFHSVVNNDDYDIGGLVRYFIKQHYNFETSIKFIKNGLKIITHKNILKHNKFSKEGIKNVEEFNNEIKKLIKTKKNNILFGYHPYGFNNIHKNAFTYGNDNKFVAWLNDPHYFAHMIKNKNTTVQNYNKPYDIPIFNKFDMFLTPSPIYFKNLGITKYNNKIKFLFYVLNKDHYNAINYKNYNSRTNNVILSGACGGGYITRTELKNEIKTNKKLANVIYYLHTPGYKNNEHMTEMNYYNKLSQFKGAFVGHYKKPLDFLLAKHIEVLMCGCLGFFEKNPLLKSQLGLEEFVHYVPATDENNKLIKNPTYYLTWLNKGKEIAERGATYVREKFGENYQNEYIKLMKSLIN